MSKLLEDECVVAALVLMAFCVLGAVFGLIGRLLNEPTATVVQCCM